MVFQNENESHRWDSFLLMDTKRLEVRSSLDQFQATRGLVLSMCVFITAVASIHAEYFEDALASYILFVKPVASTHAVNMSRCPHFLYYYH